MDGEVEGEEEDVVEIERLTTLTAFFGCCFLTTAFFGFCNFCCLAKMRGDRVVIGDQGGGDERVRGKFWLGIKS
jgi:hypothetical protein